MASDGNGKHPIRRRVAIYTRVSTDERLRQDFNSLDAQRAAVESFVASQRAEGWVAVDERYDDAGFTGANTNRPAFRRMMADIEAGKVDIVACYKLDRLSRSLADFANTLQRLDSLGVGFVSTTQQFSTTTSSGRMIVNVLATFAQFEREQIAERTRDKMGATRIRGGFTGGRAILGYDVFNKRLVVNPDEAGDVRRLFAIYCETQSLLQTARRITELGIQPKTYTSSDGTEFTSKPWTPASVRLVLRNPAYAGLTGYRGELRRGLHDEIVPREEWDAVQALLKRNGSRRAPTKCKSAPLLSGKLFCGKCASYMSPHYTLKGTRKYGAYVCQAVVRGGAAACPGSRISSHSIEWAVVSQLGVLCRDRAIVAAAVRAIRANAVSVKRAEVRVALTEFTALWGTLTTEERRQVVDLAISRVEFNGETGEIRIEFKDGVLANVVERESQRA